LAYNKNKKTSSLIVAIIVVVVVVAALSSLPIGSGDTLALMLFSIEPAFGQLSGQANLPYGEQQEVPAISPPPSSSATDFGMFMDSFTNSIFNGTSAFAGVGTSIVDRVEVSGISLDKSQNQLSIILRSTTAQGEGSDDGITNTDANNAPLSSSNSSSVSIIAMRIPISTSDILSIAGASSSSSNLNSLNDGGVGDSTFENQLSSFSSDNFNPFSLLSSLQIGSSILIGANWSEPQTVTMDLIGGTTDQEQQLNSSNSTKADLVLVSVIPYTGIGNNTISSAVS
jgi:hypothetical protein